MDKPPSDSPTANLFKVSGTDVQRYLVAKKARGECPSCGQNDWSLVDPTQEGVTYLPVQNDPSTLVLGGPMIPVALMICKNCNFLRFHGLIAIERWKREEGQT